MSGLFFEKRSQPMAGRFFRDLPGRRDGDFMTKGAMDTAPNDKPVDKKIDMGEAGAPPGNAAAKGEALSGGIYGTGDGDDEAKSESTKKSEAEHKRLRELLDNATGGTERKAEITKESAASPSDWDTSVGLPVGHHRPAAEPPEGNEGLEAGGERFFATDVKDPNFNSTTGTRHGLLETGGLKMKASSSPQMGKHASDNSTPRFLGTPHGHSKVAMKISDSDEYASADLGQTGRTFAKSLGKLKDRAFKAGDEAVQDVAKSPTKAGIAALAGGVLGYKALKGLGRGGMRLVRGRRKPPAGLLQRAGQGLSSLITGKR